MNEFDRERGLNCADDKGLMNLSERKKLSGSSSDIRFAYSNFTSV